MHLRKALLKPSIIFAAWLCLAAPSWADFRYAISGGLQESYNDNFFSSSDQNRDPGHQPAYITTLEPGFAFNLNSRYGEVKAGYSLSFNYTTINEKID